MDPATSACTWCGAGGDNGAATSFQAPAGIGLAFGREPTTFIAGTAAEAEAYRPRISSTVVSGEQNLQGIGGWLILLAAGLALSPLGILATLGADLTVVLTGEAMGAFVHHETLAGLLAFDTLTNLAILAGLIALNFLFYRKKKNFPRWMIGFLVARFILVAAIHQVIIGQVPTYNSVVAIESILAAVAGIPYLLLSRRVKQTFVN